MRHANCRFGFGHFLKIFPRVVGHFKDYLIDRCLGFYETENGSEIHNSHFYS